MPELTPILDLCGIVDAVQLLNETPPIDALRSSNKVVPDASDVSPTMSPKADAPRLDAEKEQEPKNKLGQFGPSRSSFFNDK